jgi:hypothetical protein
MSPNNWGPSKSCIEDVTNQKASCKSKSANRALLYIPAEIDPSSSLSLSAHVSQRRCECMHGKDDHSENDDCIQSLEVNHHYTIQLTSGDAGAGGQIM